MTTLKHKVDFAVIIRVKNANPNGDPSNGNRPRIDYDGYGEISDVCLKRKMRDRLLEAGQSIFVQAEDKKKDDAKSLRERADRMLGDKFASHETATLATKAWFDVRAFGQLFAIPKKAKAIHSEGEGDTGISIPVRGPVTVQPAFSVGVIDVVSTKITKSVSAEGDGTNRGADTIGMKHRVKDAVYVFYGAINPQLADRTGFSEADTKIFKQILPRLFENDASSSRPSGSMEVLKVIWWQHNSRIGQLSSAKVHRSLQVANDGTYKISPLMGLVAEEIDGF